MAIFHPAVLLNVPLSASSMSFAVLQKRHATLLYEVVISDIA